MIRLSGYLLLVAVSLGACGSSGSSGSGATTGGIPPVCPAYAMAICNLYGTCSNGWYVSTEFGDQAACVASYELSCAQRLAAPGTALTSADILSCSQGLPTENCDALYSNNPEEVCAAPSGNTPLNGACEVAAQCASAYCAIPGNAFCGTCQPVPTTGASCSQFGCPAGLQCLADVQTCAPGVADGGACNAIGDCQFGLTCLSKAKICAPTADGGQACDTSGKIGPGCNDSLGLVCQKIGDGGMCAQKELADAGQACGMLSDSGVATNCADRGTCQKVADSGVGTCLAAAAAGSSCDTAAGPECQSPARCIITGGGTSGMCQLLSSAMCTGDAGPVVDAGGAASDEFFSAGTFTASGADSGVVSASLTGIETNLGTVAAGPIEFNIAASKGDPYSTATFTSPSGIAAYTVTGSIYFAGPPTTGTTITNTNSCGGTAMSFGTASQQDLYLFLDSEQGADCSTVIGANSGSYTLSFTSVSGPMGLSNYYLAHGSFKATMPDATGDTGMLNLTF